MSARRRLLERVAAWWAGGGPRGQRRATRWRRRAKIPVRASWLPDPTVVRTYTLGGLLYELRALAKGDPREQNKD